MSKQSIDEVYKPVTNFVGLYQVSNLGNVRSTLSGNRSGKVLKQACVGRRKQYRRVMLSKNTKRYFIMVHKLVAAAFIPNITQKPIVNHLDGNGGNNNVNNLEWCTYSQNEKHAYSVLGKMNPRAKLTYDKILQIKKLIAEGKMQKDIAKLYDVSPTAISRLNKNITYRSTINIFGGK